jgi:hypothetical protein
MGFLERSQLPEQVSGTERAFEVKLGSLGGVEVRPTRLFVWKGEERDGNERLVPIADRPVGLDYSRRESTVRLGALELRTRGNPVMTLAIAGALALKRLAEPEPPKRD